MDEKCIRAVLDWWSLHADPERATRQKKCELKKRPSSTKSQNYKNKHSGLVFGEQNSSSGTD